MLPGPFAESDRCFQQALTVFETVQSPGSFVSDARPDHTAGDLTLDARKCAGE